MVVQHNLQAMNASRMLGVTTSAQSKATEKLSSGYRINRAADDAAGLTISEKMRKQIRGLDQASTNAQDGVSAVQTAEGALTEVHSMLQRMNELATQASNGTNSQADRDAIQAEIDQLTTEIDRVAETTKFNETYLLKGNTAGKSSDVKVAAHDAGLDGALTVNNDGTSTFKLNSKLEAGKSVTIAGQEYTIGNGKSVKSYDTLTNVQSKVLSEGDSLTVSDKTYTVTDSVSVSTIAGNKAAAGDKITTSDGTVYEYKAAGTTNTSAGWYKEGDWADSTAAAAKVLSSSDFAKINVDGSTYTKNGATAGNKIVSSLDSDQISTFGLADKKASTIATKAGLTIVSGDSVTVSGDTITATTANYNAASFESIKDGIMGSAAGNTVKIADIDSTTNAVTYTIVENVEDETETSLTRESIIAKLKEGSTVEYTDKAGTAVKATAAGVENEDNTITAKQAYDMMVEELTKASSIGADTAAKVTSNNNGSFTIQQGTVSVKDSLSFSLHVGADADMTNKINVDIESMSAAGLGIKGLNVSDDTGVAATYAIDAIADAISKVSSQRSALGAVQNRLEHTIANVDNVVENTTSAESRIRDTDMAEMMVEYSKNNILAQAGQSMLAQANQSTQGVLSLLS